MQTSKEMVIPIIAQIVCGACTLILIQEIAKQNVEEKWKKYKDKGLLVIGICVFDSKQDIDSFTNRESITFPMVIDDEGKTREAYKIRGIPSTYLMGRDKLLVEPTDENLERLLMD